MLLIIFAYIFRDNIDIMFGELPTTLRPNGLFEVGASRLVVTFDS